MEKAICNMDCFNCQHSDCINLKGKLTEWEKQVIREAHIELANKSKEERKRIYDKRRNERRRKYS